MVEYLQFVDDFWMWVWYNKNRAVVRKDGAEQRKIGKFSFRMRENIGYDTFYFKKYL